MFCPKCGDEFRPGFTECPDCMVPLVDKPPVKDEDDVELVEVSRFSSRDEALAAARSLEAAGIRALVPDVPGTLPLTGSAYGGNSVPVLVPGPDEERAVQELGGESPAEADDERPRREIARPLPDEYAPSAAKYMALVPEDVRVLDFLAANVRDTEVLALSIGEDALEQPYGPGKWTGKQLLVHITDDERIFSYRALRFARRDRTELPGFEEKDYAEYSLANERSLEHILRELAAVRQATIELFDGLDDEALTRTGIADGKVMSVRAAAYHIAGHELHHVNILRQSYP
jgi:uncharacterized damage-inducible protein DinB